MRPVRSGVVQPAGWRRKRFHAASKHQSKEDPGDMDGFIQIVQIIINGIATGSVYALIAVGFSVIFNILKFSNFSHGALMTVSAMIGYFAVSAFKLTLLPTILIAMVAGSIVMLCGELVAFRRITKRNTSPIFFFVSSITLGTMFEGIASVWIGANFWTYAGANPNFFNNVNIQFGPFVITASDLVMLLCSVAALALLTFFTQKTRMGRGLRSVSFDRDTAGLMGINVSRTIQVAFAIAGAFAGLAGVFLGIKFTLTSTMGTAVVKGFIASVIGGLGSMSGAVIGAVLLGLLETILTYIFGTGFKEVFTFLIMLVFLLLRPQGIAGSNVQEKA